MKLYNTLSRQIEDFTPMNENKVSLYTCGLTVYSHPHIGNWVAYIYWDILVRTLRAEGYDVNHVQNITDVGHLTSDEDAGEDKMLKGALREGKTAWEVADKYITIADTEAFSELGLLRPTHMPRATEFIPQQIAFVQALEEKGFTYVTSDGVYFNTSKVEDYGKLARLDIEGLRFGARVEASGKRHPTDFAVWKFSPPDQKRDMEWDSPWGKGFPGWHLECSVMAKELLGDTIDIHSGGIDHIPVHHTNEIAQSEALTLKPFAHFWLHANHIKVNGTKMSKSLGNVFTLEDIKAKGISLEAFKLMILSKHYRTEGNFTWEILEAAANRLRDLQAFADLRYQTDDAALPIGDNYFDELKNKISDALADDLDTPLVLKILNEVIDNVVSNTHGINLKHEQEFSSFLEFIDDRLGLNLSKREGLDDEQQRLLNDRMSARSRQDWQTSDFLRSELEQRGILTRDTESRQIWFRKS